MRGRPHPIGLSHGAALPPGPPFREARAAHATPASARYFPAAPL
jgi:hypothetical protein